MPESPLSGKAYDIGEMVYHVEKTELRYPSGEQEFSLLKRADIKYEESRKGQIGSPLRYPSNEEEWKVANIEGKPLF